MIVPLAVANLFCLVLGYLYPAYASFKTLDAPQQAYDQAQVRRWLVYWVVISAFSAVELLGDSALFWFPFYYECKMAFIAWLVLPYFNGSTRIYRRYIEPLLEKYYPHIDTHVENMRGAVQGVFGNAAQTAVNAASNFIVRTVSAASAATTSASASASAAASAAGGARVPPAPAVDSDTKQ
jgi:hypothetical protein